MTPETIRMVEELLSLIQQYSGQKDTKSSEMFYALVSALFEAKEHLDFRSVGQRGKWGSPAAKAFATNLKKAFQKAIAKT